MKCRTCRAKIGEGGKPIGLMRGLGDESKPEGGYALCTECTMIFVDAFLLINQMVQQVINKEKPNDD